MYRILAGVSALLFVFFSQAQDVVLFENFNSGIPSTWTMYSDTNSVHADVAEYDTAWITVVNPDDMTDSVASSTSYFDPADTADRWLITPQLTLGNFGNYASWYERSVDASFADGYFVLISNTDSLKESFTDTIMNVSSANPTWLKREIDLTEEGYANQSIYIAFVNNSYDKFKLLIDSVEVVKNDPVSVPEITQSKLKVYPNPVIESLNFSEFVSEGAVFDLQGKSLLTFTGNEVDLKFLQAGVYFVKGVLENGNSFQKRIVKR